MKEKVVLVTQETWNTIKESMPLGKQASQHGILPSIIGARVFLATDADIKMYPELKEYGVYTLTMDELACWRKITAWSKKHKAGNTT